MSNLKLRDDRKEKQPRKVLSERLRFEVLKRDAFTCQYCGYGVSDGKILEIDHIIPYSKGGTNEKDNLITSCKECNRGKTNTELIPQIPLETTKIFHEIDVFKPTIPIKLSPISNDIIYWSKYGDDLELKEGSLKILDSIKNPSKYSKSYNDFARIMMGIKGQESTN